MISLRSLIAELRVIDLANDEDDYAKLFVLYTDKVFILDEKSSLDNVKAHLKDHPALQFKERWNPLLKDDVRDFVNDLAGISSDIVTGIYYPDDNRIRINGDEIDPKTSINIKKLAKALKVDRIETNRLGANEDDIEIENEPSELKGDIPDVVYHGTSTEDLESILTYGLYPLKGTSKFQRAGIYHEEHIFFTGDFNNAIFYANNATLNNQYKRKSGTYPIVLKIKIPDKNLIFPDYDADISTTSPRYFPNFGGTPAKSTMKSMGISRETSKWSYKGRIPASHILAVYYYNEINNEWIKTKPRSWIRILKLGHLDNIAYKLGMDGG